MNSYLVSIRALSLLIVSTFCDCEPSVPRGPPGQITLTYLGTSGSDMRFLLDNRTNHSIYFSKVSKFFGKDPAP
jgi:hypothetical protein